MPSALPDAPPRVTAAEYRARQERVRDLMAVQGSPGVAVVGRGGGTYDRHGDLWYLTGHYQAYPYLHDRPPLWSGRSHAVLVLPVAGPSVLLCSAPEMEEGLPVDDMRSGGDFAALCRDALDPVRRGGRLVGLDALPASLARQLPLEQMLPDDDLLEPLRRRKSVSERAILRHAAHIASVGIDSLTAAATEGATEAEAVAAGLEPALRAGAWPYLLSLAAADRTSSYTGRPSPGYRPERPFRAGELVRLDYVIVYDGYYADFGRTFTVGSPDPAALDAVTKLRRALDAAIQAARPGATAGDVAAAATASVEDGRLGYPPHWGHGLGLGWEGPWLLPGSAEPIEQDYALAIEATIHYGDITVSGEENLLVGEGAPEVLSTAGWPA
jgi:Xaa-Pro aminopeptidase